jgi:hypothetical protein
MKNFDPQSRPLKLGKMAKNANSDGLVLINPAGQAYAIDNDLSTIWLMLDGEKTYQETLDYLCQESEYPKNDIEEIFESTLEKLIQVNLAKCLPHLSSSSETSETSI